MRNLLIMLAALLFTSACGPTSTITTPSSFVALSEDSLRWKPYHYKAVSPDGAVIVVREHDNSELHGTLDYWTEALRRQVEADKGYTLKETAEVTAGGLVGTRLYFEALYAGEDYRYDVALFVTPELILTVEVGASAAQYERYQEEFEAAMGSLTR